MKETITERRTNAGIIGHGSFGQFAASVLAPHAEVFVCDVSPIERAPHGTPIEFDSLKDMDCIILAVPLTTFEAVLTKLQPMLRPETLVVDVCSVKVKSRDVVQRTLNGHKNLLICHPLFGPQSAMDGTAGHQLIVTDMVGEAARRAVEFCANTLELHVMHISAEEHDKAMAYVHVLTFFVARGLGSVAMNDIPFETPSFQLLRNLIEFDHKHSDDLFTTIQLGNPYGDEVRRELVAVFSDLEQSLQGRSGEIS